MIRNGELAPGGLVPGEDSLMETYGVARETARKALAVLKSEGLVKPRRGQGTFVTDFKLILRDATRRLSPATWGNGRSMWDADLAERSYEPREVRVTQVVAPSRIAHVLGVEAGSEVVMRDRIYLVEGRAVVHAVSYLPADLVAGTPVVRVDPGPGGIYRVLTDLGHGPVRFREEVAARPAGPEERSKLGLSVGACVLHVTRTAYRADGRAVEVAVMELDAAVHLIRYDIEPDQV